MKWLANKNHLKIIIICMLFIFLPTKTVLAKENTGSISLYAHYLDDGKIVEFVDMPFQIVKVADIVNGQFVNVGDFKDFKNISTNMNASQMKEMSYALQAYMKGKNISFTDEKNTNKNGIVQFKYTDIEFSRAPQFMTFLSLIKTGIITYDWRGYTSKSGKYTGKNHGNAWRIKPAAKSELFGELDKINL